jgi:hypothetical protein
LTKSATAAMFTSVWVDFGWPPLSSSTNSLPSRNREYHLQIECNWPTLCIELNHSFIWYAGSCMLRHPCAIFMELLMSSWVTWKQKCLCCLSYTVNVVDLCAHRHTSFTVLINWSVIFNQTMHDKYIKLKPPKNVWSVQNLIPISILHQYWCFCRR